MNLNYLADQFVFKNLNKITYGYLELSDFNGNKHFFGNENPRDIAKKCLRVNLSDMAAMGAKPVFYNLSISVPKNKVNTFIPAFAKGLKEDQEVYNIKLIGGDLTASLEHINITITI